MGGWQGEIWDRHKDGSVVPKSVTLAAVKGIDGVVTHFVGSAFDLSERKLAESTMLEMNQRLTQSQQKLRNFATLTEKRVEDERQHIAREVHDELGQILTALRLDLSLALMRHISHLPELKADLDGMRNHVDRAILGVRNVATSLRPAALDMGLVPSIAWLCREFSRRGHVKCDFTVPDQDINLDANRDVVIFRIVQESLTNVRRYARASHVTVHLAQRVHELSLEIRDNGIGFDPDAVAQRSSLGLLGMSERALALGGNVAVDSRPGQGTVISVTIPLKHDRIVDTP